MILYKLFLKFIGIKLGNNVVMKGVPVIFSKKKSSISIGDNVIIKSSFFTNLIGINHRVIIISRTNQARINIGNNVGISGATIYARKGITIGDNTLIGANSKIFDNDFHPIDIDARNIDDKSKIRSKEIIIGQNCFIGCNTIILKGTQIGSGSVVGAGSVVSGIFPENVVIAGNPARIIKKL